MQWLRRSNPRSTPAGMDRDAATHLPAVCGQRQAKPRLLIIYHYPNAPEDVFADMSKRYTGEFVVGRDLDIY